MSTQLVTPMEVARGLEMGRPTVFAMLADGRLPAVRFGQSVRVSEDALEAPIRQHSQLAARSGPLGAASVGRLPSCPEGWPSKESVWGGPEGYLAGPAGVRNHCVPAARATAGTGRRHLWPG